MFHFTLNIQRQGSEVMSVEPVSLYWWTIENWLPVQVAAASTSTAHERAAVVLLQGCVKLATTQQLPCMEYHWHQDSPSQSCRSFRTCCSKLSSKSASKKHHINTSKNITKLTLPCVTFLDSLAVYTAAEMIASVRAVGSRILLISVVTAHIISHAVNLLQTRLLMAHILLQLMLVLRMYRALCLNVHNLQYWFH